MFFIGLGVHQWENTTQEGSILSQEGQEMEKQKQCGKSKLLKTAPKPPKTRRKLIYCLSKLDFALVACGGCGVGGGIKMFKQTSS